MRRLSEEGPESRIKATSERKVDLMGYVTGKTIRELREKRNMTQRELAEKIQASDKTVSKCETEKGLPDIRIIEDLAKALGVSLAELLTGDYRENENVSANMKKLHFYVCPVCGNITTSVGHRMLYVYCNRHGMFGMRI